MHANRCRIQIFILGAILLLPAAAQAQFNFTTNSDGSLNLSGYTGSGGAVTIPNTTYGLPITSIGNDAFEYLNTLTSVIIGTNVTSIGDYAFYGTGLSIVSIPAGVTNLGIAPFGDCNSLSYIIVSAQNPVYTSVDGILFNQNQTTLIQYPGGLIGSYTIPASVTNIETGAFILCTSLSGVTIGTNVASIGDDAFFDCLSLTSINIPASVTSIGAQAFAECTILTNLTLGANVNSIGSFAFFGCLSLTSINIPASVTNIGTGPFSSCINLTNITVAPQNLYYSSANGVLFDKGQDTLIQCPGGLNNSYTIPASVTNLGSYAFYYCPNLPGVTIPAGVTNLGSYAFAYCDGLTSVFFQGNAPVTYDSTVFEGDNKATLYYLPGTTGWSSPFAGLPAVLLDFQTAANGGSITITGDSGAYGALNIPATINGLPVTSIGDNAFENLGSVTSVTIPNSVTNIGSDAFLGCTSLGAINVDPNNPDYSSLNGVLFNQNQTTLIQYPNALFGSYTIPDSVTSIGAQAFAECSSLTSVTIPNSVTSLGEDVFNGCTGLTGVYFAGNAPNSDPSDFTSDNSAVVYYLPGATGWSSSFGGVPTGVWSLSNPLIQNSSPTFGVRTNAFGFNLYGAINNSVVIQACTNLANPVWSPIATNVTANGSAYFSDPQWTNYSGRFYRISSQPPAGMALIPAGSFTLGDNLDGESDATPTVSTAVSAFYLDTNLVTYSLWQTVYDWATNNGYGFVHAGAGKAANHPAYNIDWYDAVKWCNARSRQAALPPVYYTDAGLTQVYTNGEVTPYVNWSASGYRLPTEAEWEKAARGGLSGQRFPWGSTISESQANYYGNTSYSYDLGPNGHNTNFNMSGPYTSPVGYFAPNGYGLYDMAGNVNEWCWDWYGTPYPGGSDPTGVASGSTRVLRGGSWNNYGVGLRCANRGNYLPIYASDIIGFRCAAGLYSPPNPLNGMASVPAGTFTMGDTLDGEGDALPTNVTVSAFDMDANLVSYSQWQSVYDWARKHGYAIDNAGEGQAPNQPVQTVNWYDCVKWCNARSQQAGLTPVYYTDAGFTQVYRTGDMDAIYVNWSTNGYRLPTEAEWEKAARGGLGGQRFPWGNTVSESQADYYGDTNDYGYDFGPNGYNANFDSGSQPYTSPVGSFPANGYGLYDMAGNVFEWCWDWYAAPPYPAGSPYLGGTDPRGPVGPLSVRVLRGGDWLNIAYFARCATRNDNIAGIASTGVGFRCVKAH
jgi:formylglycine-generating enzyme required for sulfatase activity